MAEVIPHEAPSSIDHLLEIAVTSGNVDQLDKLLEVKLKFEADEARKAYSAAMTEVQSKLPTIIKDRENTQTNSWYATLDQINKQITPIYTAAGLSISFGETEAKTQGWVRIEATVRHSLGHSERFARELPMDDVGLKGNTNKTAVHAAASSSSYAQRYLICQIFNIATGFDDDGNAAGETFILQEEADELADLCGEISEDFYRDFLARMHVENFEEIPARHYGKALKWLQERKKRA